MKKKEKPKLRINMRKIVALLLLFMMMFTFSGAVVCGIAQLSNPPIATPETQLVVAEVVVEESADVVENTITAAAEPEAEITYTNKYTTTGLNIRTEPNTDSEIYKTVPMNTQIKTVDNSEKDGWIEVNINDNKYYVYSKYLSDKKTVITASTRSATTKAVDASPAEVGDFQGYFTLTYYCACKKCCGKTNGITAWGTKATAGRTIATSSKYAFGTKLVINGHTYVVEDRGGAIQGNKIDVYVDSHSEALKLGVKKNVPVYIGE